MTSPTKRTLAKLKKDGWLAWVVEHWNGFARIRQDLFGFVDVLAVKGNESLYIQCTSRSNVSARIRKIVEHDNFHKVKSETRIVQVWGWKKGDKEPRIETL